MGRSNEIEVAQLRPHDSTLEAKTWTCTYFMSFMCILYIVFTLDTYMVSCSIFDS